MGFPAIFLCAAPLWRRQPLLHTRGIFAGQAIPQPGTPLVDPPRPAVFGDGEGDLGLQVRLGVSGIGLPGGQRCPCAAL
jgi:hypothetical protein